MVTIQQGFPQLSSPIADQNNSLRVTQPWQQFFISLWNRTGAQQGGSTFNPGDLKAIAGTTPPAGWLLCDGSAVSRTQFVALYNNIGVVWGAGDNITTFNVPNLQGRIPIGSNTIFPLGTYGGTVTTTLSLANLPTHNHGVNDPSHTHTISDPGHNHTTGVVSSVATAGGAGVGAVNGTTGTSATGITINPATTGITTQNTGSGTPFSNLAPYAAVNWIIKT